MFSRTIRLLVLTLTLMLAMSSVSYADISDAAMLFLRIAPGARAAGLGEAFVAISDDATASHWNPAGLGAFPLAADWLDSEIPNELRPVTSITGVRRGSANNYLGYELWALTAKGLMRYDNRQWYSSELFSVPSSQSLEQFVGRYFSIADEDIRAKIAARVAIANNKGTAESLVALKDSVMAVIPEDYSLRQGMADGFDSLITGYGACRLDWNYIEAISKHFAQGNSDGNLSEREIDRINVAVERAHLLYILEEINIPFSALFDEAPTVIESNGDVLLIGSPSGLYQYRSGSWTKLTLHDGLPSENILALKSFSGMILVGTDDGLVVHDGFGLRLLAAEEGLPSGPVMAMGGASMSEIYVVVNNDLYRYDGSTWKNWQAYTVVLDDSRSWIADKYSLYGTAVEKTLYLSKLASIDQFVPAPEVEDTTGGMPDTLFTPPQGDIVVIDSLPAVEEVDTTAVVKEEELIEIVREFVSLPDTLNPGTVIKIPMLAEIRGEVYDLHVQPNGRVWLGTEYGAVSYQPTGLSLPGWDNVIIAEGDDWTGLIAKRAGKDAQFSTADSTVQQAYIASVKRINDLSDQPLEVGQSIKVYARPNAYAIDNIGQSGDNIYFTSETGLLQLEANRGWQRADFKGLGNGQVEDIITIAEEIWFLSDTRVIARGRGKTEITLMHTNWLPSLASDLFYEYIGFVTSHDKIGTFGGNITFISYGSIVRTGEGGDLLGTFEAFEAAVTLSYGTSLTKKLKGGVSAKFINSHLSQFGAAAEKGNGITSAVAMDLGLMYQIHPRLNFGLAITNLGPSVQYSDNSQKDALPRNIAAGAAWKALQSDNMNVLFVAEANKSLVDIGGPRAEEFKEIIWSAGLELDYMKLIAIRAGYYYDEAGQVKNLSFGAGVRPMDLLKFDFAYIPSNNDGSLDNTLRLSLTVTP